MANPVSQLSSSKTRSAVMLPAPIGLPNPDFRPNAELSDLDLAILEEIRKLDPALLDKIRKFDTDVLDELRKIEPALLDGLGKIHPTLLHELRKVDPAVLQEMQVEPAEWDPAIIGAIRNLYLKLREEDEEVADMSTCSGRQTANGNQKTQSEETDGGGGENKNENSGEEMKVGEERGRSHHYPVRPEAGEGKTRRKNRKNKQNYFRSGGQRPNLYASPNPGNDDVLTPNPGKVDMVLQVDPAELDPAIFDAICKLSLKEKEEGEQEVKVSCSRPETEIRNKRQSEERDGGGGGENKNENGGQVEKKIDDERSRRYHYPARPPGAGDSSRNLKTGTHKFGSTFKFNRARRGKNNQLKVSDDKMKEREGFAEKPGQTECKNYFRSGGQRQNRYAPPNPGDDDSLPPTSDVPPNPGNDGVLPPNPGKADVLPPNQGDPDRDLATRREILRLKTALLGIIRKLDGDLFGDIQKINPAVLREMQADPAEWDPAIIDVICKLSLEEKDESEEEVEVSCSGPETEIGNENGYKTQSEGRHGGGGNKNENGGEVQKKVDEERSRRHQYPVRPPGPRDSSHNLKTGTHQFGSNCKFNLTRRSKNNQVSKNKMKEREGLAEKPGKTERKVSKNKMKEGEGSAEKPGKTECKVSKKKKEREGLAEKPGKTECKASKNKMKEGEGSAEKPSKTECKVSKNKMKEGEGSAEKPGKTECKVSKNKMKEREGLAEKPGKTEFKNYSRSGGRKSGNACDPRRGEASVASILENFMGLPIRPEEKDCPCYMQTLSCMYGSKCRFNHPDPTPVGESDPPSENGNDGPASLKGASSATAARWYAPISLDNAPLYEPIMIPSSQEFPSQTTQWNGYQAPERSMPAPPPPPPPYVMNHPVTETNTYEQYPRQKQVQEFPERPGQPVCLYFSRTGDCKHKSNCKYHHPKNQTAVSPSCAPSDKGLPLRPGQNICTQYSAYGICNSGPACKFNHP